MPDFRTFTYADALKLVNENQYERLFLKPLEEQYAAKEAGVSAQRAYDYTSAYNQYMQQQRSVTQSDIFKGTQNLLKTQLGEGLQSSLQASDIDYAEGVQKLITGFSGEKQNVDKYFTEQGEKLKQFFDVSLKYKGVDWTKATTSRDKDGLGLLSMVKDETGKPIGYEFTEEGNRYFQELMYGLDEAQTGGYQAALAEAGLSDWYLENMGNINEIIGTSREDWTYTSEEANVTKASDIKKSLAEQNINIKNLSDKEIVDLYSNFKDYGITNEIVKRNKPSLDSFTINNETVTTRSLNLSTNRGRTEEDSSAIKYFLDVVQPKLKTSDYKNQEDSYVVSYYNGKKYILHSYKGSINAINLVKGE